MGCGESKHDVAVGNTVSRRKKSKGTKKKNKALQTIAEADVTHIATDTSLQQPEPGKDFETDKVVAVADVKHITVNSELNDGDPVLEGNKEELVVGGNEPGKLIQEEEEATGGNEPEKFIPEGVEETEKLVSEEAVVEGNETEKLMITEEEEATGGNEPEKLISEEEEVVVGEKEPEELILEEVVIGGNESEKLISRDSPDQYFSSRKEDDGTEAIVGDEGLEYFPAHQEPNKEGELKGKDELENGADEKGSVDEKEKRQAEKGNSKELALVKQAKLVTTFLSKVVAAIENKKNVGVFEEHRSDVTPKDSRVN